MLGLFISFEGIDGTGKSLQASLLRDALIRDGVDAVLFREPGSSKISEKIREIILSKENSNMTSVTEALLYAAARAQLVSEYIKPALNSGALVISDRYVDSSIAFQGFGRDLGYELVFSINKFAVDQIMPDITFLLDLPPNEAAARRSGEPDRLESEPLSFHERVRNGYLEAARLSKGRIEVLDARLAINKLHGLIYSRTQELLTKTQRV